MVGILVAHQDVEFSCDMVLDLQAVADAPTGEQHTDTDDMPQVHALNCLKDIFTDSRLASLTERHMADTIEIAVSCLDSRLYALLYSPSGKIYANKKPDGQNAIAV